jgi:hypothetical protein
MNRERFFVLLFSALASCAGPTAAAQVAAYRFNAANVPVGKLFHYEKSNLDGTRMAHISVYMPAVDRVEALKWDEGGDQATLVQAMLDWSTFSVRRFDAWLLARDAAPERRATLEVEGSELRMSLMAEPLVLTHWPWHSYDFDFTSLNLTLPHLRNPEGELVFWRTDFVYQDPPAIAELGEMRLRFERAEMRARNHVRRYALSGEGLAGARGTWWADRRTGLLVEYEIPVGDEPGYDSVRLRLSGEERMSAPAWERFKRAAVGAN